MIASLYAPKLAGAGDTTYAYAPVRKFALPLLLTLQKFVELLPFGERSHQLFALPQVQQIQSLTHILHSGRSLYRCRSFFFTAAMSFASSQMRSPQRCIAL